jgi:DNA-cytosine methyltransferase
VEAEWTVGSLFAGIGGIDLGFERAGFKTVWQVEQNEYCRKVLAKNFPDADRSVTDVREAGKHNIKPVDVIVGGFPCQDVSYAGLGEGLDGERSGLWSHMHRIIGELRPRYVLVENVSALLSRGLVRVLCDLAEIGYDAEWDSLQAGYFGAPHERERVFILAYPNEVDGETRMGSEPHRESAVFAGCDCKSVPIWLQAASSFIGMDDGIPAQVYCDRVGALGNAVVPEIPYQIALRIKASLTHVNQQG